MQMLTHLLAGEVGWATFVAAFLGGVALNLTPCVYPMIPVTLAFFAGQGKHRAGPVVVLGLHYVLGIALSYAGLGFAAAKSGALVGSWLQQPAVLVGLAALVVALALGMFGLYELQPPRWLIQRLGRATAGRWGAFVMGSSVGLVAAPCIGPIMVSVLLYVGQVGNPGLGFLLLFTMGLGMGAPYLLLAVAATRVAALPKAGRWLVWTKRLLGVAMLVLALYFLKPLLPARDVGSVGAGLTWQPYTAQALDRAREQMRPAVVDIYADWCIPCVELDHVTFRHPEVAARLSDVVTLRVDATRDIPPEAEPLLARYRVYGVPTILLFDAQGQERPELRVTGFVPPQEFLGRLDKVEAGSP